MAAGQLSGSGSEELHQPAEATQQVRLQEVLWEKGHLSFKNIYILLIKFFFLQIVSNVQCTYLLKSNNNNKNATTDCIYDPKSDHGFLFF